MSKKICGDCVHFDGRASCSHRYRGTWGGCKACSEYTEIGKPTLFDRITASPEVLAEKLVYRYDGNGTWRSFLLYGYEFLTQAEAISATVAKLKEVAE